MLLYLLAKCELYNIWIRFGILGRRSGNNSGVGVNVYYSKIDPNNLLN